MINFTPMTLVNSHQAYIKTIRSINILRYTFYDYLGEAPKCCDVSYLKDIKKIRYQLSNEAYRRMMFLHGPHAATMIRARMVINEL